ncbi:MAG: DUF1015 family protein [Anaerovoracaceae bacterium]
MAKVRPFKALRPQRKYADKVASLPYDVMSTKEAKDMAEGNKYSFLHITRSEIDFEDGQDQYTKEVYCQARDNMNQYVAEGVFCQDPKPMIYVYRQTMGDHTQTGIVGCVSIDEYENDTIKKHELTRKEKEKDRINHFNIANANTEPVFLTYKDNTKIRALIESYISNHPLEYDITTIDGINHKLWAVTNDSVIAGICGLFDLVDSFYIADGHHRAASAFEVGKYRRNKMGQFTGSEEFNYFMAAIFPDRDLKIYDYNRVVKDLNGRSKDEFIEELISAGFVVELHGDKPFRPGNKHEFGMFLDNIWYKIVAQDHLLSGDLIEDLDVSILQQKVLSPILGIEDPRLDVRIDFIGGIRGLEEIEKRVNEDMKVGFSVYPVDVKDIIAISDLGGIMPPKSTWFEPKLASGLFVHEL